MLAALPQMRAIGGVLPQSAVHPLIAGSAMIGKRSVQEWVTLHSFDRFERHSLGDAPALHRMGQGTE